MSKETLFIVGILIGAAAGIFSYDHVSYENANAAFLAGHNSCQGDYDVGFRQGYDKCHEEMGFPPFASEIDYPMDK